MKLGNRRKRRPEYLLDVKVQTRGRSLRASAVWRPRLLVGLGMIVLTGYGICWLVKHDGSPVGVRQPAVCDSPDRGG